jgi:predicted esterase
MEGASIERVAQLIAHMTPVWEIPEGADHGFGYYELTAPGHSENGDFQYAVQLPPEYDPYRKYPTLVTLCGANHSARQELDFWAGTPATDSEGRQSAARRGQAMRHGYITISIAWKKPQQYRYEYSLREHEAVLATLRDACRRFSVDTDRVFLTGHGIGGNAAWDIAISHPDLWAGVIPFVAALDPVNKYQQFYWDNGAYVPMVFVCGEKDGLKMSKNADLLDKYFLKRFDVTVVEYLGRGHEPFHDEIQEIFAWMAMPQHRRTGPPQEFICKTMRPWDNFFWWIEGRGFPNQVLPGNWPQRGASPTQVEGRLLNERLTVKTAAAETTIWLGPDLVDFEKTETFRLNGRRTSIEPSLAVLLEDVRTRGDRQRPFWAKLEMP